MPHFSAEQYVLPILRYLGWPLVWKAWKCQWIWQLSGKCEGLYYKSGKCQGKILSSKSGLKLFIVSCIFVSVLDFAELVHFILVSYHALLHSYFHTPTPLTITLVPAGYENTLHGQECREPSGKCHGIVREFHIVSRVVTLVIIFYSLEHCVKRPLNPSSASRSTRCMPSVFRKICRAFSVLCPLLNIRVQTIYFLNTFRRGPSVGRFCAEMGQFFKNINKFVLNG